MAATKDNLKPLKMLVFSMGLVLIGGTIVLVGLVWSKLSDHSPQNGSCRQVGVDLTGHGTLIERQWERQSLHLTFKKANQLELITLDRCNGKIEQSLTIQTD